MVPVYLLIHAEERARLLADLEVARLNLGYAVDALAKAAHSGNVQSDLAMEALVALDQRLANVQSDLAQLHS